MAKEKKRLSKNAKAALKLLNDSKLLAVKNTAEIKTDLIDKPPDVSIKLSAPNKMRPAKKRG